MALRVTQSYVSVLGADVGALRSTQTYVSVLGADTGALRVSNTYIQVLTDAVFIERDVTDTLALTDDPGSNIHSESVEHELGLTDEVVKNIHTESVVHTLSMDDEVGTNYIQIVVSQSLGLTQTVRPSIIYLTVNQTISLSQTPSTQGSEQSYSVSSFLSITDTATPHFAVANRSIIDHLDFVDEETGPGLQQFVSFVYDVSVTTTLALSDSAYRIHVVTDTLELVDSATAGRGYLLEDELELDHEVDRQIEYGRSLTDTMVLGQAVAYEIERSDTLCTYTPFVGTNGDGDATTPPSTTEPTLGSAILTLTYPYVTPTSTLVLRNPEFGNQTTLNYSRIFGETRGGTLIVFSDPIWPKIKTLSMQINALSEAQVQDLLDFFGDSLGQEIGLLDWENRQWRGIILTPDAEVTDNGECNKTVSIQFEGELV
jgi:hypothetical protein